MIPMHLLAALYKPGKFGQWIAAATVSVCAVSCGLDFAWPSSALPQVRAGLTELHLDITEQAYVVSSIFLGNLLSPFPSGRLMQTIGPRNSLCVGIWLQVCAWLLIWLASSFVWLIIARILAGVWVGLVYTVVPVYIGEAVEPKIRGKAGALFGVCLFGGSLLQSIMGLYLDYYTIALICCAKAVVLALALCLIPESPYFHVARGRLDLARASLDWLRGWTDAVVIEAIQESVAKLRQKSTSWKDLFTSPSNRKALLIVEAQGIVQRMSGLTILFAYVTVTLPDSWLTAAQSALALNIVWIVSCIICGPLLDRFGRRPLMALSCGGCGTVIGLFAVWFYLRDLGVDVSTTTYVPLLLILGQAVFYAMGIVSVPMVLQGEMFPPEIKATASALTSVVVAFFSGLTTNIFLPIEESIGLYFNFAIASVACFSGVLVTVFLMIETKGRTLEEIQVMLAGNKKQETPEANRTTKF